MIDCKGCQAYCCRQVGKFPYMKDYDRGDGVCRFLDENNRCSDYENRPPICNTDVMFERYFSKVMSREAYDKMNSDACNTLKTRNI